MSFSHYADPVPVVADENRKVHVSLGEVSGLDLAYLSVESPVRPGVKWFSRSPSYATCTEQCRRPIRTGVSPAAATTSTELRSRAIPKGALTFYTDDTGEEFGYPQP